MGADFFENGGSISEFQSGEFVWGGGNLTLRQIVTIDLGLSENVFAEIIMNFPGSAVSQITGGPATVVPEPSTYAMILSGVGLLALRRFRRQ